MVTQVATKVVDADSHVEEDENTWSYLDSRYRDRAPRAVQIPRGRGVTHQNAFWLVDGQLHPQPFGNGATFYGTPVESDLSSKEKRFSPGSQTLRDIDARLSDLTAFGINETVLFPTALLAPLTDDVCFETALIQSYNTWLAERCSLAPDRLKWVAPLPIRNPAAAAAEIRRAKRLGAVGGMVLGTAGQTLLHDRSLDPVYEALCDENLPLCVHVGWSHPGLTESCDTLFISHSISFTFPVLMGFASVVGDVLDRFPTLRAGFFEAGGDWLPWMVQRMDRYLGVTGFHEAGPLPSTPPSRMSQQGRVYVTVEGDEQLLPAVLKAIGEGQVMASADIPHSEARDNCLAEISERGDLSPEVKRKILSENPRRFFQID